MVSGLHERALVIAREAHAGQTRRHGAPYIGHPLAVRTLVEEMAHACDEPTDDALFAVSLLHDVLEDFPEITKDELAARFGDRVANDVALLTKEGKGAAAASSYYARLIREASDAVRLVKVCDRLHNLSELHLAANPEKLTSYVDETLFHVVPLARSAKRAALGRALEAALLDGIRAACRAQRTPVPAAAAQATRVVPLGVYPLLVPPSGELASALETVSRRATRLAEAGVGMIQLRAKGRADRDTLALAEALQGACAPFGVPIVVNDRADLALAARVAGVHLGQGDLPPLQARRIVGPDVLVGASSHTEPQLLEACADGGADHVAVGPVYASPTKQGHAPVVGVEALARRARLSRLPIVAIGGITDTARVATCARAGASLVALVSGLDVEDPRPLARRMSSVFAAARAMRDGDPPAGAT